MDTKEKIKFIKDINNLIIKLNNSIAFLMEMDEYNHYEGFMGYIKNKKSFSKTQQINLTKDIIKYLNILKGSIMKENIKEAINLIITIKDLKKEFRNYSNRPTNITKILDSLRVKLYKEK